MLLHILACDLRMFRGESRLASNYAGVTSDAFRALALHYPEPIYLNFRSPAENPTISPRLANHHHPLSSGTEFFHR